jgi:hypothetical protein
MGPPSSRLGSRTRAAGALASDDAARNPNTTINPIGSPSGALESQKWYKSHAEPPEEPLQMTRPLSPYGPGSAVIRALYDHLTAHYRDVAGASLATLSEDQLSELVNMLFWASLRKEEGNFVQIAISVIQPDEVPHFIYFADSIPLTVDALTKLSPALANGDSALGVLATDGDRFAVWGICEEPVPGLKLTVQEPGHVLVELHGELLAKVAPGAKPRYIGHPRLTEQFRWMDVFMVRGGGQDVIRSYKIHRNLERLAGAMQHGRGGTFLLVPNKSGAWEQALDFSYRLSSDHLDLRQRQNKLLSGRGAVTEQQSFQRLIRMIGQITAVDGATVITEEFSLVGFGAKIKLGGTPPSSVLFREFPSVRLAPGHKPLEEAPSEESGGLERPAVSFSVDCEVTDVPFSDLGGMRHRSAAQFVYEYSDCMALVASQDGGAKLFWSVHKAVHAMRLESEVPTGSQSG